MANDVILNVGSGGQTVASEDIGGVQYQRIIGVDNSSFRVSYTAAQTSIAILTPTSGKKLVVMRIRVSAHPDNTVNPAIRIGFHSSTTPTGSGCIYDHPGLPSGFVDSDGDGHGILGVGGTDEKLLITSAEPTGGSISIVVGYRERT